MSKKRQGPTIGDVEIKSTDLPLILDTVGRLGQALRWTDSKIQDARAERDFAKVRGGVTQYLLELRTALAALYGDKEMWALDQAISVFEYANSDSRHPLIRTSNDPQHQRQDSLELIHLKTSAAALLNQACKLGGRSKQVVAGEIGSALNRGGFLDPSGRTVESWSSDYLTRRQPKSKALKGALRHPFAEKIYDSVTSDFAIYAAKVGFDEAWKAALKKLEESSRAAVHNDPTRHVRRLPDKICES